MATTMNAAVTMIVERWAADKLARGEQIYSMQKWSAQARERVLQNEQDHAGYIKGTLRAMSTPVDDPKDPRAPSRVPAADALRRLYDAKVGELASYGVREPDRITIAVDYACGEVWRCSILPMPEGGIVRLEDELYAAIGFDRVTGVRFPPKT